jgi:hypothetical protein
VLYSFRATALASQQQREGCPSIAPKRRYFRFRYRTCLDFFGLTEKVLVGPMGKMTDILAALQEAIHVVSL